MIMLIVFGAFGGSELQVIQQIGIGLALAVFIDATLIRLIALPAAMRLMGRWNWWAPTLGRSSIRPGASAPESPVTPQ